MNRKLIREFLRQETLEPHFDEWEKNTEVKLIQNIVKTPRKYDYDIQLLARGLMVKYFVFRLGNIADGPDISELDAAIVEGEVDMQQYLDNHAELLRIKREKKEMSSSRNR